MKKLITTLVILIPVLVQGQSASSHYQSMDRGAMGSGGYNSVLDIQQTGTNPWYAGGRQMSLSYTAFEQMAGGFIFPCGNVELPTIMQEGDTLFASGAVSYQWYQNGQPVVGATDSFYVVTITDFYNVEITDANGCTAMALDDVYVIVVSTGPLMQEPEITIYPNPVKHIVHIVADGAFPMRVALFDMGGQLLLEQKLELGYEAIPVGQLAKGVYLIQIRGEDFSRSYRIVKAD